MKNFNQINLLGADFLYPEFLEVDDICFTIKEEIAPLVKDSDFEDMYKNGGRPPVPPRILAMVTLLQFLEKLSDRSAVMNLKYRIDWKIALNLPIDFPGIHSTTLHYFRERLVLNKKSSLAFDKILDHLISVGLIKKNKKQRIDSTHIIANVKELSRLELISETLRLFCKDTASYADEMDANLQNYRELYIEKMSARGVSDAIRNKMILDAGVAMKSFIEWQVHAKIGDKIFTLKSFQTLKVVFEQNFTVSDSADQDSVDLIKIATGKGHISSPHDCDAEYANKGKKGWIGYKAQIVETVNGTGQTNFITVAEATTATKFDGDAVSLVINNLQNKEILPSEFYGDTHYNTMENIEHAANTGIELKGPVAPVPAKEAQEKNQGFKMDEEHSLIICPMGVESIRCDTQKGGKISATFPQSACDNCARKLKCRPEKRGKRIEFRKQSKTLNDRRKLMETEEFKKDMHHRNGIEGTLSGLVRGQSMRRLRYKGFAKANFQIKFCAAAANVSRLHRYRNSSFWPERSDLKMVI